VQQPVAGVPEAGQLVLEPVNGSPDFTQQGSPVDLALEIIAVVLLDRSHDRAQRGKMFAGGVEIEATEAGVF
jgi:hypothetical protein